MERLPRDCTKGFRLMRCLMASCFGLALIAAACGCRSCHRVESELRAREQDVLQLREDLDRCSVYNQTLQSELRSLRGEMGVGPDGQPPAAFPVKSIALGRQTGGRSSDNCPGDESLQVQVEPRDPEGQAIKAPGMLVIQVQEINPEGIKRPLSSWEVPQEQLRRSWRSGLLTSGYVLNLPWKVWPSAQKLRVTAQFQLADGRVFEAEKDISVRLTPPDRRPVIVPDGKPTPSPLLPHAAEESGPMLLPTPRKVDPIKISQSNPGKPAAADIKPQTGTDGPQLLWEKVDPPPPAPSAEILRPVPLNHSNIRP
jgi:hypothetical protein